jgi:integrase
LLAISDIDPSHRLIRIRAETTKDRSSRVVPYSASTGQLLVAYLSYRHALFKDRNALFVSESSRNRSASITLWTWSKVVHVIAKRSGVLRLSTHTFRHLCLTDLARAGWELHEIATFAGHRSTSTTLLYIHLSGRELTEKLARAMTIHSQRILEIVTGTESRDGN